MLRGEDFWSGKSVFVTGSAGFLGCWLANELHARGANVVGADLCVLPGSNFHKFNLGQKITQLTLDITNYALLKKTLERIAPDFIFHLAARPLVTDARKDPLPTFENNVAGTWNLLEAARGIPKITGIIIASSDKAYGIHEKLPYTEDAKLQGTFPYDVSKSAADLIAQSYHKTYGLPVCVTRCGNIYGGGDLHFDRIVPGTIKSLLLNENPTIRSDGTYTRDYIYVKDVVAAYLLLAEKMAGLAGEAFNFSTESPASVLSVVEKISKLMGKQHLQPNILNTAKAEIKDQYLSSEKAKRLLDWKSSYTMDTGLAETVEWYKTYFGRELND